MKTRKPFGLFAPLVCAASLLTLFLATSRAQRSSKETHVGCQHDECAGLSFESDELHNLKPPSLECHSSEQIIKSLTVDVSCFYAQYPNSSAVLPTAQTPRNFGLGFFNCPSGRSDLSYVSDYPFCSSWLAPEKKNRIVYSFGIAKDFSFDKKMSSLGYEVHSFDPTVEYRKQHEKTAGAVKFHFGGLPADGFQTTGKYGSMGGEIRSLSDTMTHLGHQSIEILKVDCEGCEVYSLIHDPALLNVRILVMELHFCKFEYALNDDFPEKLLSMLRFLLVEANFKIFFRSFRSDALSLPKEKLSTFRIHPDLEKLGLTIDPTGGAMMLGLIRDIPKLHA